MSVNKLKSIVLAGGYGLRFYPFSKAVPKEFLPFIQRPALEFILDELRSFSLIESLLIVHSKRKKIIENYFKKDETLDSHIKNIHSPLKDPTALLQNRVQFHYQKKMKGTADALLEAEDYLSDSSYFLLFYPDDILLNPIAKKLYEVYQKYRKSILCVVKLRKEDPISSYGIVKLKKIEKNTAKVLCLKEKPQSIDWEDPYISIGIYFLEKEILSILKDIRKFKNIKQGEEFFLTEAFNVLIKEEKLLAYLISREEYFSLGNPLEYLKSITRYAYHNSPFKNHYQVFLKNLLK